MEPTLTIPHPVAQLPRHPRTPPHSWRLQVWTYVESVDQRTGSVALDLGRLVWEEPAGRELTWEVPSRMSSAWFWMGVRQPRGEHVCMVERGLYEAEMYRVLCKRASEVQR